MDDIESIYHDLYDAYEKMDAAIKKLSSYIENNPSEDRAVKERRRKLIWLAKDAQGSIRHIKLSMKGTKL
jgi:hypothetical protein